jgi:hypothetical protein
MAIEKINLSPDQVMLKQFGIAGAIILPVVAGTLSWWQGISLAPWILLPIAAYCAVGAVFLPACLKPLYVVLTVVSYPIGLILAPVIFGAVYYCVLTPVALVFRLVGRDALTLKLDSRATTYWVERPPSPEAGRYFKQF